MSSHVAAWSSDTLSIKTTPCYKIGVFGMPKFMLFIASENRNKRLLSTWWLTSFIVFFQEYCVKTKIKKKTFVQPLLVSLILLVSFFFNSSLLENLASLSQAVNCQFAKLIPDMWLRASNTDVQKRTVP